MTSVVVTHAVGDMDTWLGGGAVRSEIFKGFCSAHRIYRHTDQDQISIVFEDVDMAKMKDILSSSDTAKSKASHTVIDPVQTYIEVEGGA